MGYPAGGPASLQRERDAGPKVSTSWMGQRKREQALVAGAWGGRQRSRKKGGWGAGAGPHSSCRSSEDWLILAST